jgi:hypothetical protein
VRWVPVVIVVWPAARSSPASPPIKSRCARTGTSRGRGNDGQKTTSFCPDRATSCAYLIHGDCDDPIVHAHRRLNLAPFPSDADCATSSI